MLKPETKKFYLSRCFKNGLKFKITLLISLFVSAYSCLWIVCLFGLIQGSLRSPCWVWSSVLPPEVGFRTCHSFLHYDLPLWWRESFSCRCLLGLQRSQLIAESLLRFREECHSLVLTAALVKCLIHFHLKKLKINLFWVISSQFSNMWIIL